MIDALKIYMLCACQEGGGAERVKPLIRTSALDRGLPARRAVGLRWTRAGGWLPAERSGSGLRQ